MRIGCAVRRIDNLQQQQVVNASPSREEPRHVLAGCLPEYHHGYLIGVEIVSIWYQTGIITVSHELCTLYE
jgi:tetrahydromethanopterin S-methyltransferase subunit B